MLLLPDMPVPYWESPSGDARVFLGEALSLLKNVPGDAVDCIWADPPYFLSNDGVTCVSGRMVNVNKGEWDRSRGVDADHAFNRAWLSECYRVLKPAGTIWVSGTFHVYLSVGMAMRQIGYRILNDIVWEKPAPPPNLGCRCFTHATEIVLWATKARKGKDRYTYHYDAMKQENQGKQMKNVWRDISPPGKEEKFHGKHPTQKPVALVSRCLRASTNEGNLVLDPFLGSGTTGVASIRLGRKFLGFEADPGLAEIAMRRMSDNLVQRARGGAGEGGR
ncbi:MAG TPA: site-specific DNA-methyltransferase [Candidatus Deferrimicrobiaceae bacterium]